MEREKPLISICILREMKKKQDKSIILSLHY